MKRLVLSVLIPIIIVSFYSCSKKNGLSISHKNFNNEILPQSNLEFTFSEDVVDDSLVDIWQTIEYIKIEPKVEGKFKWINKKTLSFSPTIGFAPSTDYTAKLTDLIIDKAKVKKKLFDGDINHQFHTTYLSLLNTNYYWAKTDDVVEIKTQLAFNYIVKPNEVANHLDITIDGKQTNFLLKSSINSDIIELSIPEVNNNFEQKKIKITLKAGLGCLNSTYKTTEDIVEESNVPSKGVFQITEITGELNNDQYQIGIVTNQGILLKQDFQKIIQVVHPEKGTLNNLTFEPQEFGITIKGDFEETETYEVVVSKDFEGVFGGKLDKETRQYINFVSPEPKLLFSAKSAIYLTNKGERNLGIKALNIPEFDLQIYKIYENNILHFLRNANAIENYNYYEYDEYDYDNYDGGRIYYGDLSQYGKLVTNTTVTTANLPRNGKQYLLNLNLNDNESNKGIYIIKVNAKDKYYLGDSKIVAFSDLGLIVKENNEDVFVFTNSIQTTNAESNVKIDLISRNNQTIASQETDGDGLAYFKGVKKDLESPFEMVLARKENDFTYLHLNQTKVDLSRFDMGGEIESLSGYQMFIYGERDLYRPGENINYNTILRDDDYNTIENLPIEISITNPKGAEIYRTKGNLNKTGAYSGSFKLPKSSQTGTYNIEVFSANKVLLNSKYINVEEFMPDRISVNTKINYDEVTPGQIAKIEGVAANLFGTPAASRNYEVTMALSKKYLNFKKFPNFNFEVTGDLSKDWKQDLREGKTDSEGRFSEDFPIPSDIKNYGIYTAKTFSTVFDENGRPISRINNFDIVTQNNFIGIGPIDYYLDIKQPVSVALVSLDKNGNDKPCNGKIQIVKFNWKTILQKNEYGEYRYKSQKQEQIVSEKSALINQNTIFKFTIPTSGEYAIRVYKSDAKTFVESQFYAYGYGFTSSSDFEVNQDGEISIVSDKELSNINEELNLIFKTPFDGKLLVCVERNKIFEHHIIDAQNKSASLKLSMKEEHIPNVFISATLLRPISSNTNLPLTVAHGYLQVKVQNKALKLPVTIESVESSRSKTKQTIKVKTGEKDVQVTLAVVDEGILQIKNYKTPDPYEFFFRPRKLQVNSFDLYPRLFPELKIQKASFGADYYYNVDKRNNPLGNNRVNLVSFWSGHLNTNANGEAVFNIEIPQFSGDLRIMAVAYKGKTFGSADRHMKVADPIVISSGIPRFMAPNDKVMVPVTLSNTTNKNTEAIVKLNTGKLLTIEGSPTQKVTIEPNTEKRVYFTLIAQNEIGENEINVVVNALGENFMEKTNIGIRPSSPLEKSVANGILNSGSTEDISSLSANMIPTTVSGKIIIGKSPLIQFSEQLGTLLRYPYGCVEQTVSTAFPQIYFTDLCKAIDYKKANTSNPNFNVQQAIDKLNTMQLYNGGLSYWQGGTEVSYFGSVYAAHFMVEAQKAGFKVDPNVLEKLLIYIGSQTKNKQTETYSYYLDESYSTLQTKTIVSKEVVYSLYILALAKRQDLPTMNYLKSNINLLSLDCKYLLASTFKIIGDQNSYRALLPSAFEKEITKRCSHGSFYSYLRDESLALNALLEVDPSNKQVQMLANHLSLQLNKKGWYSTQELAFSMLALGKLSKNINQNKSCNAIVTSNGKSLLTYNGSKAHETYYFKGTQKLLIKNTGQNNLYYFVEYEGIDADGKIEERDSYLKIRRSYYDRNGYEISGNTFKQNDLIVVKLSLQNLESSIENVVVTDLLPSGFEIENPRLTQSDGMQWINDQSSYSYLDVRDDRIHFFTDSYGTKNFYYLVRAVSPGTFVQGPASADAMYNGEYHSYNGSGTVKILVK